MIKAQPSHIWKVILGKYFERKIRTSFFKTHIRGLEKVRVLKDDRTEKIPVIFYCNHSSWWDAAVTVVLSLRVLMLEAYGMMEERQLEKYAFFTRIGMFSVVRENAREALQSLEYAAALLKNTKRALWIFPQGKIEHAEKKPIDFENGLAILLKKLGRAYCIPVAIRYEFLKEERAECFISIGTPELLKAADHELRDTSAILFKSLSAEIDALRSDIIKGDHEGFTILLKGAPSVEKRWDSFKRIIAFKNNNGA